MKTILLLLITEILLVGCVTIQPKSFKTLKATQTAVVAAMEAYRSVYNLGGTTPEQDAEVKAGYEEYQRAFGVALTAARFDYQAATPVELATQVSGLILLIESL